MSTAIVTGASRGLGWALAAALHGRGYRVVVDARDGAALEAAWDGWDVTWLAGDVGDESHLRALVAAAGEIDVLVNNAGLLGPSPQPSLAAYPLDALRPLFEVNVFAPLRLMQLALPQLRSGARVINVTSDAAREAYAGWGGYGASKAALEQLTNVFATEHPEYAVYCVDPGDMNTVMHQSAFPGEDISDRPAPGEAVPGLLSLIEGGLPSGRYRAAELEPSRA
jgi:NAD(P)-dependent dehydrogenase (short-subunit alcohol dehydrogenase family)